MEICIIYVQFNDEDHCREGFICEWEPGYYPSLYSTSDAKYAKKFPSTDAAKSFIRRLEADFDDLTYWEIVKC